MPSGTIIPVTGAQPSLDDKGGAVYIIGDSGENGWKQDNLHLKLSLDPDPASRLSLGYTYSGSTYFYEDPRTYLRDPNGIPVFSGTVSVDRGGTTEYISNIAEYSFLKGPGVEKFNYFTADYSYFWQERLRMTLRGGVTDQHENWYITTASGATAGGGQGKISETPNTTTTAELQFDWEGFKSHVLTIVFSRRWEEAENSEYDLSNWRTETSKVLKTYCAEGEVGYEALGGRRTGARMSMSCPGNGSAAPV